MYNIITGATVSLVKKHRPPTYITYTGGHHHLGNMAPPPPHIIQQP